MLGRPLAWSLTVALVVALLPSVGALPEGVLVVAVDTTYEGGVFVFPENVVVLPGATLTFRDAHVFLDAPETCPSRGTAGYCQPSILATGATVRVLRSTLDSHGYVPGDLDSGWTMAGVGARFEIVDSTLRHYKSMGTQSPGEAPSLVRGSTFVDARGPVSFIRGAVATVEDNSFQDVAAGVSFHDSPSILARNAFRDVGVGHGPGAFGRAIDVQSTVVGDKAYEAMTLVEENLVENAVQGMLNLNGFPNVVRNNVFRGNGDALVVGVSVGDDMVHEMAPVVEGNAFEDNGVALSFYTSGVFRHPDTRSSILWTLRDNAFVGTACSELKVLRLPAQVTLTVDARENWWGSAEGPQDKGPGCPAFDGTPVLADPWLTSDPRGT